MNRNDQPLPQFVAAFAENLYTSVRSVVLDELGYRDQVFPPSIRPLDDAPTLVAFARTGIYREVSQVVPVENPYELEIALVDDLKPHDIPALSTAARARGVKLRDVFAEFHVL